jgi:ribosomal protein S13
MNKLKKKLGKQFHFNILKKKYLGIKLTTKVKDLYNKNYKTLKKEIEEEMRRQKDLLCSWISRIS